jgi:excinuclease ABC subunit C
MQSSVKFPEEIKHLPLLPGVYIMKGEKGKVLYIGKAKSLRKRVSSYTHPSDVKTLSLKRKIKFVEFIVVNSEEEALLLENNLIKKFKPPFNIRLVDDENYPYIKITNEEYPRLMKVYRIRGQNGEYFGPFPHGKAVDLTIKAIRKIFPIRTCNIKISDDKTIEPCLLYRIGLCSAPCAHKIAQADYLQIVESLKDFLRGDSDKIIRKLSSEMEKAKRNLEFERAAIYRDQIKSILSLMEKQNVVSEKNVSFDAVAVYKKRTLASLVKMSVRHGKLVSSYPFMLNAPMKSTIGEIIEEFFMQNYFHGNFRKIYVKEKLPNKSTLEKFLSERNNTDIRILSARGTLQKNVLEMAEKNARVQLDSYIERRRLLKEKELLENVKDVLGLSRIPFRIEGYDISNVSGQDAVGSMVVFTNGKPDKNQYRKFKIKFVEGPNDFAMLKEVLFRRFKRGTRDKFSKTMPDLLLIDGGKGQLDSAIAIKRLLGVDVNIASLAKKEELIFVEGKDAPIRLSRRSEVLKLMQRVRDESHRFAKKYFTTLHNSGILKSKRSG